ncbi:two component transcriptional regulator, winged helix family protein [Candidatus Saccharibacteria bacterium RAAC3_TM7_1]|nr:two component transcriptional regulator, winged helix family protein [Candidatus Saccharibacteria bacterium RAAC3_TM7_1]HCZ28582.1 DNA-binding response regulator [Candidatus Saccharibacteria bacterium]
MRILVVEDEHKIAQALKRALEQEHYAVDVSYDGDDGYAMATTEPYDAMIIDRMIPGEYDGIGIVKAVREQGIHVPILLLTALGRIEDKTMGLDSGADDYLTKPFAIEELLARLRALLRRPASHQPNTLNIADLELDTVNKRVTRAGQDITLTAKEFSLLEYLLRNKHRPANKDMIIQHVWDYDADILPNTVEVYIKYLRTKIDKPFKTSLLQTIRGFGYKLEDK